MQSIKKGGPTEAVSACQALGFLWVTLGSGPASQAMLAGSTETLERTLLYASDHGTRAAAAETLALGAQAEAKAARSLRCTALDEDRPRPIAVSNFQISILKKSGSDHILRSYSDFPFPTMHPRAGTFVCSEDPCEGRRTAQFLSDSAQRLGEDDAAATTACLRAWALLTSTLPGWILSGAFLETHLVRPAGHMHPSVAL